jgi:deoxycytidine triphosphate deaminase
MPTDYWKGEGAPDLQSAYWVDPLPDWQGMLSSDLISYYNEEVGGMIGPWDDDLLRPASYELTLGPVCLVDGVPRTLTDSDPWLEIPSNSIVFVSMAQWVRLPHYIAARFDLAIEFIYQGILLGTGPQVDPGFQGVLSCPLHNISSDPVHMRFGHAFAKMDFAKTSGLWYAQKESTVQSVDSEGGLERSVEDGSVYGIEHRRVRLFNPRKRWREPIFDVGYAGKKRDVRSSLANLESRTDETRWQVLAFGDDIQRIRRFGLASAIVVALAIAALLIALAQLDRSYTDSIVNEAHGHVIGGKELAGVRRELRSAKTRLLQLSQRVRELQRHRPRKTR